MTRYKDDLARFSISMEESLLRRFDERWPIMGVNNRSEAVRDLVRRFLVEDTYTGEGPVLGILLYVYDHHVRETSERIVALQHDFEDVVVVTMHVHLDHNNCMELAVVRGEGEQLNELTSQMRSVRGIKRCSLLPATTLDSVKQ